MNELIRAGVSWTKDGLNNFSQQKIKEFNRATYCFNALTIAAITSGVFALSTTTPVYLIPAAVCIGINFYIDRELNAGFEKISYGLTALGQQHRLQGGQSHLYIFRRPISIDLSFLN